MSLDYFKTEQYIYLKVQVAYNTSETNYKWNVKHVIYTCDTETWTETYQTKLVKQSICLWVTSNNNAVINLTKTN